MNDNKIIIEHYEKTLALAIKDLEKYLEGEYEDTRLTSLWELLVKNSNINW